VSWWDHEVLVWRIIKNSKSTEDGYESESEQNAHNRKLVARIILKGDESITSASISPDGKLVAVATAVAIKVFSLKERASGHSDGFKVVKLAVPESVSTNGAKIVQFSPDARWLCLVRNTNRVALARIHTSESEEGSTTSILETLSKVNRLDRKLEKRILLGGLGAYERGINRVAFSSDSRILAVSDLAGYIDTWVLEGSEDLTRSIEEAGSDESGSSEDESENEDEESSKIIFGQHWIRNPSSSLLPKLPAAPAVLAFRPATAAMLKAQESGSAIAHPTRHNPHPISRDLPNGEDRLLIVTASNKVLEFEVLRGGLSSWSRRNPTSHFPEKFTALRDQAMGCFWDLDNSHERLWLYGSAWVFMFDLSRDLTVPKPIAELEQTPNKKRKRGDIELRKNTTGAGSKIPDAENETGMSRKMQRVVYEDEDKEESSWVGFDDEKSDFEGFDDDEDMSALGRLRQGEEASAESEKKEGGKEWWHTFKYRPIMGVVPLMESGRGEALEVALVERPLWEVDMAPRFYGDQEWEKSGL
jgi:U3 small nucleolar RNA-associated protein 4